MTQFWTEVKLFRDKTAKSPIVPPASVIDHFAIQLSNHHFNLKIMAKGLRFKGIRFKDLKKYYGLKGKTAADCLEQFKQIKYEYLNTKKVN